MKKKSSMPSQLGYRIEYLTRLYEVVIIVGLVITPLLVIGYLVTFSSTPALRFVNHGFHEIIITIATLVGGFVTYVSWRSYQASGEIFLRWLTVGFLAFTIIYTPHGLFTRMADHNMWLFLLYGPVSRIVILGCFMYGLLQYGKPAENVAEVTKSGFWWRVLILCVMVDIGVAVLAYSPIASSFWVRTPMEIGAIVLALSGISIMLIRHINLALMKFFMIALVIFAQAPIAFILAEPWEHLWWLAHIIFAVGFFIISWGVTRALLTTRSFSLAYSQEQLMVDISVHKATEEALQYEKSRIMAILNMVGEPIFVKDNEHRVTNANHAFYDLFDMDENSVIGNTLIEAVPEHEREHFLKIDRMVLDTGESDIREEELTLKGHTRTIITSKVRFIDGFGKRGLVCSIHDITERKQAEEEKVVFERQLQHSQKQDSLGQLSGGIAHNFNNILAIIIGYCGLTKTNILTAEKNIPIIEKAAERAVVLCRQMMAYSGKEKLTITKVNMAMQVDETIVMLKPSLPQNAIIKTNLSASIPMIEGDVSQLNQVVMNLIINASEAIGIAQGEVNVSLDKIEIIAGKTFEDYSGNPIPPGEYVCLEVTDSGCGMDETTLSRLFEPFYTTKFTGRGLGMSAVLGIIKSHGGVLQLFSQPSQGTTFKVFLPALLNEPTGDENRSSSPASESWQGSGTILLVEDEDEVRFIAKELLKMFGFTVLEAVNGKEALEMYQKNAADIMLVFTDIGMPVMDGYELVEKLKKLKPELPIIISTGYGDADVKERIGSDNIARIARKPYNADKLREVLKSVVEGI
jgi:PAS domain S-box-containing protein